MNIANSVSTRAKGVIRILKHDWGKRTVIGIPYVFLILLFSVPFLVVLKLSVSETDGIHFEDLTSYADGVFNIKIKLSNYIFLSTSSP